jgi:hypothetical protein
MVLLMRDLGLTSAGCEALLAASGAAEKAAEHRGGGPKLPLAAEFGSFGRVSPTPAQLHSPHLGQL